MVKIRLTKTGRKNAPSYRIVATDSRKPRDGKYIEVLGYYNPSHNPELFDYNKDRYKYWLSVGAQPTESVKKLVDKKYTFVKYNPKAIEEEKKKATEEAEKKAAEAKDKQDQESKAQAESAEQPAEENKQETAEK